MPRNDWNPALYDGRHAYVHDYGQALVDLLDPQPGERVLDLGCGTGHLTAMMAASGAGVVGLDSAPAMVAAARAAYPALSFVEADARDFTLTDLGPADATFDAVFSNAALHWVRPPEAAVQRIGAALRPGGRFVAELGGAGNVDALVAAVQGAAREVAGVAATSAWYFPSIAEYTTLLEAHGLLVRAAWLFDRPTPLAGADGLRQWLAMFAGALLAEVPDERRDAVFTAVADRLRPTRFHGDHWLADYRRLRVVAAKQ